MRYKFTEEDGSKKAPAARRVKFLDWAANGTMRKCPGCKKELPFDAFYKRWSEVAGKMLPRDRCIKCCRSRDRAFRERNPNYESRRNLQRNYGLTEAEYDGMLKRQDGVCRVCGRASSRRLHVDHDHATGKVRGLLCESCNLGLGNFRDSPDVLRRAIDYLTGHGPSTQGG